jgi:hypothetical protein
MIALNQMLQERKAGLKEALACFDELDPVSLDFMQGRWKGYEIKTGHPMDGLLEVSGWYGKNFNSPEEVHPLLLYAKNKTALFSANPLLIPLQLVMKLPKSKVLGTLTALLRPFLQTKKGKARMRMVKYRGKLTGAMIYDHKAIIDFFVKIDDNTMLGVMDFKGYPRPYIFVLERDN